MAYVLRSTSNEPCLVQRGFVPVYSRFDPKGRQVDIAEVPNGS